MSTVIDTVDSKGNISFNRSEGVIVSFKEYDGNGTVVSPSLHPRYFNVPDIPIRQLIPVDPSDSTSYRLVLTTSQLSQVNFQGNRFAVTDEQGVVPVATWEGIIYERNPSL